MRCSLVCFFHTFSFVTFHHFHLATSPFSHVNFHHFHFATSTTSTVSRKTFDDAFSVDSTSNGTVKRHARENYDKAVDTVHEMELKLEVVERWTPESQQWKDAASLVASRRYRLTVNKLEELVVKRLFELTKMNMSQTGK